MKCRTGVFQDNDGNNSSSRVIAFIVTIADIVFCSFILWMGRSNITAAASSILPLFTLITGFTTGFLTLQKRVETNNSQNDNTQKQN